MFEPWAEDFLSIRDRKLDDRGNQIKKRVFSCCSKVFKDHTQALYDADIQNFKVTKKLNLSSRNRNREAIKEAARKQELTSSIENEREDVSYEMSDMTTKHLLQIDRIDINRRILFQRIIS